jgi:hypothetical protein
MRTKMVDPTLLRSALQPWSFLREGLPTVHVKGVIVEIPSALSME